MSNSLSKKQMSLAVSCVLALGIVSGTAAAQTNPADTGYLTDQRGTVVRSGYGLCWHTGFGPATPTPECDPERLSATIVKIAEPAPFPPAAPKPAGAKVTLDADTLFDFNKADLRPAGKSSLDAFLEKMKGIDPEVIIAVGHADRFGSDSYNQALSERRAVAVKTYLSKGIEGNRIHTEGRGEQQPVTKPGECRGAKSAKVIACLQPDRRVDVEVVGARVVR
ncbi:MAG: OmpA family protein [Rhodocyclaceae bacterium]